MTQFSPGTIFIRLIILFFGLTMAAAGGHQLYNYSNYRFISGSQTYGLIDHPASSRDLGGRPLVRYRDSSGKMYEFKTRAKTHWFRTPKKGEEIRIFYLTSEPDKAIADNLFHYLILPLVLLGTGTYCCFSALVFIDRSDKGMPPLPAHDKSHQKSRHF